MVKLFFVVFLQLILKFSILMAIFTLEPVLVASPVFLQAIGQFAILFVLTAVFSP
jgi:hypothetical protein